MSDQATSSTSPPPASPTGDGAGRSRRRRWPLVLGAMLLVLLAMPLGLWWWASIDGSLQQALRISQRMLPAGQQLQYGEVEGSITRGGSIGQLQWSGPGVQLRIEQLQLEWSLGQLLRRTLHVRKLQAARVQLRLTPAPAEPESAAFSMPADLRLPLALSVPLEVGRLEVESVAPDGTSAMLLIRSIAARYSHDGTQHALQVDSLGYGQSHLQADLRLHARDLTLQARAAAVLRDLVAEVPQTMLVNLQADGTLAGGDAARIALRLDASEPTSTRPLPDPANLLAGAAPRTRLDLIAPTDPGGPARVAMEATLRPWRTQPVEQARLQFAAINLAAFAAAAPLTALSGEGSVDPVPGEASPGWNLAVEMHNEQPGAWDARRLPLRTLAVRGQLHEQQLDIQLAQVQLAGARPAGSLEFSGSIPLGQATAGSVELLVQQLDLQPLLQTLPRTALDGTISVTPLAGAAAEGVTADAQAPGWLVRAQLRNAAAGPLDHERLPVDRLLAQLQIGASSWRADSLQVDSGAGSLVVQGQYEPAAQAVDVRAELRRLPLRGIHGRLADAPDAQLSGAIDVNGDLRQGLTFDADIRSDAASASADAGAGGDWNIRSLQVAGDWSPTRLRIGQVDVDAFRAIISGSDIDVGLPGLDDIQARITAAAPGLRLEADAAMQQQAGGGRLALQLESAAETVAWLQALPLIGERLPALQGTGSASLQADWEGGWRQWVEGLAQPARYRQLRLDVKAAADALQLELPASGANQPPLLLGAERLAILLEGNLAAATVVVDGDLRVNDTRGTLDTRMQMSRGGDAGGPPAWNISVQQLAAAANMPGQQQPWRLEIGEGLQFTAVTGGPGLELRATAGTARLAAPPGSGAHEVPLEVKWQPLLWRRSADGTMRMSSSGAISGIQPAWLDALRGPQQTGPLAGAGLHTDLLLSAAWDVQMTEELAVRARLQRDSGDVWLLGPVSADGDSGRGNPAGLSALQVQIQSEGGDVSLTVSFDSSRAGNIAARISTGLVRQGAGWRLPPAAPLAGKVQARLEELGMWGLLAPPGWRISGALGADIDLGGTVQEPQLRGTLEGSGLQIRSVLDGIDLHDGTLRASLEGQQLQITGLVLQGGTGSRAYVSGISGNLTQPPRARGSMEVTGTIDWSGVADAGAGQSGIGMELDARLERMQALVRNDRQLTLSGELSAELEQGALRVRGDLRVDRGTILLPDAGAPTLGDDVVVVRDAQDEAELAEREARGQLQTAMPLDLEVQLDLGRDLAVQGLGLTTRLEGELSVRSADGEQGQFSVFGEVRTDEGRYRAWGQALDIESGIVRFNGPYLNPALNLLAIRPEIEVRAGVRVTGTLGAPVVQLYSDPVLPESEVLSWVVLGRPTVISGAESSSVQQAALGLLAGRLASSLADDIGVDELGVDESAVSVGKRLSNELYVTYEAGLSGATSVLYVFYDITRRLTLRGQTGEASAVDLIYTITYD